MTPTHFRAHTFGKLRGVPAAQQKPWHLALGAVQTVGNSTSLSWQSCLQQESVAVISLLNQ